MDTHPWYKTIKPDLTHKIKYAHNSINNPCFPVIEKKLNNELTQLTVIGNRIAKEFIYCSKIIRGLYKYRPRVFDKPIIHGLTSVEWYDLLNEIKIYYGSPAYCLDGQVAVIVDDKFLGGEKELRTAIKEKYHYDISFDYEKEAEESFITYIRCSGRPCVYMHISINDEHVGTLIFMLYAEIVPKTCGNFVRLCDTRKGGYSGTPVHRVVKDCWIQCGGYGLKSTDLECENYIVQHDKRGVLAMANDGRNVDCSTQFFVLLQPAPWMACKYVAFGQLIEGEETLKKIESVSTRYESPTSKILIYRAGIFNVESPDVEIKNRTEEYLQGHVENLVKLGEWIFENILKNVFQMLDAVVLVGEETSDQEEVITDKTRTMRTAQRFIRHKTDLEMTHSQSIESNSNRSTKKSISTERSVEDLHEQEEPRKEFEQNILEQKVGVEGNVHYTSEESLDFKPERPFIVPFTDVPYPGEVTSEFNLKKFLQGDYCLESDLVAEAEQKKYIRDVSMVSDVSYKYYSRQFHHQASDALLSSENDMHNKKHLRLKWDHLSLADNMMKDIARASWAGSKHNLFDNIRKSDMIGDESKHSKILPTTEEEAACICNPDSECMKEDGFRVSDEKPSPFAHLYRGSSLDFAPTFKNQTITDANDTATSHLRRNPQLSVRGDRPIRSSIRITSLDRVLDLQHGKAVAHKISSDYVMTIDQIEHRRDEIMVGFTELKRSRPTLTVSEYQMKNHDKQLHAE